MAKRRAKAPQSVDEATIDKEADVNLPKTKRKVRTTSQKSKGTKDASNVDSETQSLKDDTPRKRMKRNDAIVPTVKDSKPAEEKDHIEAGEIQYWLMKAEPETRIVKGKDVKFSIDDLQNMNVSPWDGVRNHQAKNFMKAMKVGDQVFFYHSNCKVPGISGIAEVCKEAYPDHTASDPSHPYYDEKSAKKDEPTWFMVDVKFVRKLKRLIPLKELQEYKDVELKDMTVVGKGRLSVQPVRNTEWDFILGLEDKVEE